MKYRWGEWSLDRDAGLLKRHDRPVDVSRKVLECIGQLIKHRDRVVGYDELIRSVWGHDNVTNHQLSQVILSARRLLGDDGQAQRLIRTAPGLGYRWVGVLDERPAAPEPPATRSGASASRQGHAMSAAPAANEARASSAPSPAPEAEPERGARAGRHGDTEARPDASARPGGPAAPMPASASASSRIARVAFALALVLLSCAAIYRWRISGHEAPQVAAAPVLAERGSIQSLETALRAGEFEMVREGLIALPPSLAESPDAMLIAMQLDFYRGRFERAQGKLADQLALARRAEDPIWMAKLLIFESMLKGRTGATAAERERSIQAALDLLGPLGEDAAPAVLADALRGRSIVLLLQSRHEEALRDLNRSGELYERIGDRRSAIRVRTDRARIWMRTGRLEDALRTMRGVADDYGALSDRLGQLASLNTMTRIQMELLRWNDALRTSDRAIALLRETPESERRNRALQLRAQVMTHLGRLRQARALLEEVGALQGDEAGSMIATLHLLEDGKPQAAMAASAQAFAQSDRDDPDDILLDHREGAVLVWITAAQRVVDQGGAMPAPAPALVDALRNPRSIAGTIASGRWAMTRDDGRRAEALLREALDEARRKGMRHHMVLATEPLLDLLLGQGRDAEAERLLDDVRAFDRERMNADFAFMRLRWNRANASGDTATARALGASLRALAGERPLPGAAEATRTQ